MHADGWIFNPVCEEEGKGDQMIALFRRRFTSDRSLLDPFMKYIYKINALSMRFIDYQIFYGIYPSFFVFDPFLIQFFCRTLYFIRKNPCSDVIIDVGLVG